VEIYGRVRRAVRVEGKSQRAVAREFGLSRDTVRKMLQYAVPPGYQRQQPIKKPKLGPWLGVIDAILSDDKQRLVKQRHTAKRIFERLQEEHGFTGGYTIVKDYVRGEQLRTREMFVPLTHAPGEAQVDFGEALVVIAGVEQKAHYLAIVICRIQTIASSWRFRPRPRKPFFHPNDEDLSLGTPVEGHVRAFAYFGGVPTRILYDNTKIAVAKILGGEERKKTKAFSELQSYYLFTDKFGRPAKGNDKGKVEGLVGYSRRNFMVPIPHASSWEELNAHLEADCRKRRERRLRGHTETIGERFERDRAVLLPLPAAPYEACEKISARVSPLSLVRYRANDYSVPTEFPVIKTMDSFDFLAIPSLNKTMVLDLARCEFLARRENVLLLGNSGAGKTHIALALGLAACQRGHRVRFTTTAALVGELIEARDEKKLLRFQKQIASYELLIVDELGFVSLSKTGAELLFEMLSQRYGRGSTMITSNLLCGAPHNRFDVSSVLARS